MVSQRPYKGLSNHSCYIIQTFITLFVKRKSILCTFVAVVVEGDKIVTSLSWQVPILPQYTACTRADFTINLEPITVRFGRQTSSTCI